MKQKWNVTHKNIEWIRHHFRFQFGFYINLSVCRIHTHLCDDWIAMTKIAHIFEYVCMMVCGRGLALTIITFFLHIQLCINILNTSIDQQFKYK